MVLLVHPHSLLKYIGAEGVSARNSASTLRAATVFLVSMYYSVPGWWLSSLVAGHLQHMLTAPAWHSGTNRDNSTSISPSQDSPVRADFSEEIARPGSIKTKTKKETKNKRMKHLNASLEF